MPGRPRLILAGMPLHAIRRGNNRHICLVTEDDCRVYLDWLGESADKTGCRIRAHALMGNHVHLTMTPTSGEAAGPLMKQAYILDEPAVGLHMAASSA